MKSKGTGIQYNDNTDAGEIFDLKIDISRGADGKIVSGLVVGSTKAQNQSSLLIGRPGDFKTMPLLGVGLGDALLGEDLLEYRHRVREHFARDSMYVKHLNLYNLSKFSIDAEYE